MTSILRHSQPNGLTDFKNFWQTALLDAFGLLKASFLRQNVCRGFGTAVTGKNHEKTSKNHVFGRV